jgi:POT family proton-dependent oligopeptide transporter
MQPPDAAARGFLGHPAGLSTLFFCEMWERFSYYGMRAILLLFLYGQASTGGMGLDYTTATAIYGLYTAGVYIASLPGGWIADRLLGIQRAVLWGCVLIMVGHITLALADTAAPFLSGLTLIVLGTGLLKPNISALVGEMHRGSDTRRDAAFTLFYFAVNIGATAGPIVIAWLAAQYGWHAGFGAAAIGMAAGLAWYLLTRHRLGDAGRLPCGALQGTRRSHWLVLWSGVAILAALILLLWSGAVQVSPVALQGGAIRALALIVVVYFLWLLLFAGLTPDEKRRVVVLMVLVAASTLFWAGYEQAGSSLTLFADRFTDRYIGSYQFPTGWFQSGQGVFVLVFAPLLAVMWMRFDKRGFQLSVIVKFAIALFVMGLGFLLMIGGAHSTSGGGASPWWLIMAYLLNVLGELFLSPVGMSATTRLAPQRYSGQAMGLWFSSIAMGNLFASRLAGELTPQATVSDWTGYFARMFGYAAVGAVLLLALLPLLRRWAQSRDDANP